MICGFIKLEGLHLKVGTDAAFGVIMLIGSRCRYGSDHLDRRVGDGLDVFSPGIAGIDDDLLWRSQCRLNPFDSRYQLI